MARVQILPTWPRSGDADSATSRTLLLEVQANPVGIQLASECGVTPEELRQRTSDFARRVLRLTGPLLEERETSDIVRQLRKAATSVSANYRAAGRARSHKEFTARIGVVREESDESLHWLTLMKECSLAKGQELDALVVEAEELVKMFARAFTTAKRRDQEATERPSRTTGQPAADRKSDGRPNS